MLSMQYQPRSSSMLSATLLPDPERPLTTTSRVMALRRSGRPAARDFGGVVVRDLLLVLADHAVELVRERVDRRVHVLVLRVRVDHGAADAERRLRLVLELLDREHAVHVDDALEVPQHAIELLAHVVAEGRRDLDVVARDLQLHGSILLVPSVNSPAQRPAAPWRRALEGAMPSDSRYLATVRRATCTPSAASSSTSCWSESGLPAGSCEISLRILARIAVDDTPAPSSPATWLEKKKRNSNTPRGVCRYLPVVTREIVDSCISTASATSFRIIGRIDSSPRSRKACCRSTIVRATFSIVSFRISRLRRSQRASCSWVRSAAWSGARVIIAA